MSSQSVHYYTNLPSSIIEILYQDLVNNFEKEMGPSYLKGQLDFDEIRKSKNTWVSSDYWITGFLMHYVLKANRDNFKFDISHIDYESLQFAKYEKGEFYDWHTDSSIQDCYIPKVKQIPSRSTHNPDLHQDYLNLNTEYIRKISFSLQLSHPDDYEGGNVEFIDDHDKAFIAPRQRGSLILFDSRTKHKVHEVTRGVRRSIVGWVLGPRWK
tara:strand:- start:687 stop:1322 length:636 start_codon:yes stop_codon:yes gene_type:complete